MSKIEGLKGADISAAMGRAGHDMELLDTLAQMRGASTKVFGYLSERVATRREIIDLKADTTLKQALAALLDAQDRADVVLAKRAAVGIALVTGGEITEIPGVGMAITVKNDNGGSPSKLN